MAFIFLSSDALDQRFLARSKAIREAQNLENNDSLLAVRRPYRGIQIKDDTYATLSIIDGRGQPISLISESYAQTELPADRIGKVDQYADFIIQSINEERVEKQQIIETFGDAFIFFFGERPRLLTITGLLVNTEDFNWRSQFWDNYENRLRGSKLVQRNARAFLSFDSIVVEGYPIQASASETSEAPYLVQFQMVMFLTNYHDFSRIGVINFPGTGETFNIDAANRDLDDADRRYVPTGREVRLAAAEAGLSSVSIISYLREGIRAVNSVTQAIGAGFDTIHTLLSGRVVTLPLGVAGFVAQVGQGDVISQDAARNFDTLSSDPNVTKVKVARKARFAPINKDLWRTRFAENWDEYPLREGMAWDRSRERTLDATARAQRAAIRGVVKDAQDAQLVALNLAAAGQEQVLSTIADVINFAKLGFALVNSIESSIENPGALIQDALGVSI